MATQQPTQHATVSVDSGAAAIPSPLGIGASAVTPRKHTTSDIGGELGGFPSPPPTPAGARGEAHCVVDNVSTARNAVEAKRRSRRRARAQRRRLRRRHLRERLAIQTNDLEGRELGASADRPSSDAEATLLGGNFHPSRHRGGKFKHARDTIWLVHSCGMKVYYGWVVLAVATVAKIMSAPGQSPCIGAILVDIRCVMCFAVCAAVAWCVMAASGSPSWCWARCWMCTLGCRNDLDLSRTTISTLYLVRTPHRVPTCVALTRAHVHRWRLLHHLRCCQ